MVSYCFKTELEQSAYEIIDCCVLVPTAGNGNQQSTQSNTQNKTSMNQTKVRGN